MLFKAPFYISLMLVSLTILSVSPLEAQNSSTHTTIYLRTSNAIKSFNLQTEQFETIIEFDAVWNNSTGIGWTSAKFSGNSQFVAYTRTDGTNWWLGVSALSNWEPNEIILSVPQGSPPAIMWLPNDSYLVISYMESNDFGTDITKRELLETDSMELSLFPFILNEISYNNTNGDLYLDWELNTGLGDGSDDNYPSHISYNLNTGNLNLTDDVLERIASVPDIMELDWVWDWSSEYGFVFYNSGVEDFEEGYYWVSQDSQITRLMLGTYWQTSIQWSDSAPLILVQNHARTWYIYNVLEDELLISLDNIPLNSSITWLPGNSDLIYFDGEHSTQSTLNIYSIETNMNTTLDIGEDVRQLTVSIESDDID